MQLEFPIAPEEALTTLVERYGLERKPEIARFCRRDVLVVPNTPGGRQPFYRGGQDSSGGGRWLPFDCCCPLNYRRPAVFDTSRFHDPSTAGFDRYGNEGLQKIGRMLDSLNLPEGRRHITRVRELNRFLDTPSSECANTLYDRFDLVAHNLMSLYADEMIAQREENYRRREEAGRLIGGLAGPLPDAVSPVLEAREVPLCEIKRGGQFAQIRPPAPRVN